MTEVKFIGARLESEIAEMIDQTAEEENIDRTAALKELIQYGRQKLLEEKAIEMYREGKISVDKAAKMLSITVSETMRLFANAGITSEETLSDYKEGLKLLLDA
jgi:predicted HTH domain antitoxin